MKQGDLVKANVEFRQAIQLKADFVPAIYALATVLEQQANFDGALNQFRNAAERDPKQVDARVHLSRLLLAGNQLDTALRYADEAYALAESNPDVLALKAAIALRLDNRFDAVRYGEAALAAKPGHLDALMVLAAERMKGGDPRAALDRLNQGLAGNEKNVVLQLFRITVLQTLGDDASIEATFRTLLGYYPSDEGLRDGFANWFVSKGRNSDAEAVLRSFAIANPKNANAGLAVVAFVRRAQGADAARAEIQARIAQGGDTFILRQALAELALADGKYADAVTLLNDLVAATTDKNQQNQARVLLAKIMLAQKDTAGAGKLADVVLGADAKNVDALSVRAAVRVAATKYDDAIEDLRAALNVAPQSATLRLQLADAYERSSKNELADQQYARGVQASPADPERGHDLRAVSAALRPRRAGGAGSDRPQDQRAGEHAGAGAARPAQAQPPGLDRRAADRRRSSQARRQQRTALADQIVATSLTGQKRFDDSIKLLQDATSSSNVQTSPMAALVRAYVLAGKQDVAMQFLQSVIATNPANQTAQILIGSLYLQAKNLAAAETAYRAAIDADPNASLGYSAMAQLYAVSGKPDEAEKVARQGLERQPDDASLRLMLATVLESSGKYDEAIAEYERMFAADPRATIPANNLASLLSDYRNTPADLERAFQIASRFRTTDVPQFQDTLGWIYYLRGDYAQSVTLLKSAVDKLPGLAAVQYHLGMAYKALGQKPLAVASLQKAVDAGKTQAFPQLDKAQSALQQLAASGPAGSN